MMMEILTATVQAIIFRRFPKWEAFEWETGLENQS